MKSRVILLAAMLFALPVFAEGEVQGGDQAAETIQQQDKPAEEVKKADDKKEGDKKESWLAAKWAVVTGAGATAISYTIEPIANWTTIWALNQFLRIEYLKGGRFEKSIPTVGKTIVGLALVAAAIKGYQFLATEADDVDAGEDEEIFPK